MSVPEAKDFYKDLIDNLHDGVYFVDLDRVITYWNKGAERITGYSAAQAVGHPCQGNMLNHVTANGKPLCGDHCPLARVMADGKVREAEIFLHHGDGHLVPVLVRAAPVRDEQGTITGAVETFSNNTGMTLARRQMGELRRHGLEDPVTGIGNRLHLEAKLRAALAERSRGNDAAGLLFLDLDHFKLCNDTFGHQVGDQVLRMVASTLRNTLRATDTVGRWAGDEFICLVYGLPDDSAITKMAEHVRIMVQCSHLEVESGRLSTTVSIGATRLRPDDTSESFVGRADRLMYQSKAGGSNRVTMG
ncbi:MAG: GGDEF domain-containing protein [Candidatus Dormibacteria bacterium]